MTNQLSMMLVEKYRPKTLDEVIGNDSTVSRLKQWIQEKDVKQHVLLSGPPGIGKTTIALCLARSYLGSIPNDNFLELNASNDRKLDVVRERIKGFVGTIYDPTLFKLLLLDESDSMIKQAQNALRRMMEQSSKVARFILTANYLSGIIEPIQSRCALMRLRPLNIDEVSTYLDTVCKGEGFVISSEASKLIFEYSEGDLRQAVNILGQSVIADKSISADMIRQVYSASTDAEILKLRQLVKEKNEKDLTQSLHILLYTRGVSGMDILRKFFKVISADYSYPQEQKSEIYDKIADAEWRLHNGASEEIQLHAMFSKLMKI